MKVALSLLLVAVSVALTSGALTCFGDKNKCEENECCVKFGPVGRCKPHRELDERCEMHPAKMLFPNHVYMVLCPCKAGLKCIAKDGIVGKIVGTCQEDSSEVITEPEAEGF